MKIGVDMDSVIADIMHPLIRFHNDIYRTKDRVSNHKSFNLCSVWNCTLDQEIERVHEFYESPYFDLVRPIVGAHCSINHLKKKHDLILITARPYHIERKTVVWINKYFPKKFLGIHHTNLATKAGHPKKNKSEICLEQGIKVMIEDHLEYALDCLTVGIPVILFDQPWNQTKKLPRGIWRVHSWKEIIALNL